ncbi:MAG: protease inhibitor I42 family protein [Anaerolineaceae bacterium]
MNNWDGKFIFCWAIIILLLASACTSAGSASSERTAVDHNIILTNENNESVITIKTGERFILQLDGNITTGYAWEVDEMDSAFLKQVGEMEYREKSDPDSSSGEELVGAPGEFIFTFEALQTGETSLRLIYHRSFEEGVEPLEVFMVTVNISK